MADTMPKWTCSKSAWNIAKQSKTITYESMNKSISLNSNYARFAHRRTDGITYQPQGYIGDGNGAGVSPINIRNSKKHLSYHHHIITPIHHQYNLMFHYCFTDWYEKCDFELQKSYEKCGSITSSNSKMMQMNGRMMKLKNTPRTKKADRQHRQEGKVYLSAAK